MKRATILMIALALFCGCGKKLDVSAQREKDRDAALIYADKLEKAEAVVDRPRQRHF